MRIFLVLLSVFSFSSLLAQPGGDRQGGGMNQRGQGQQTERPQPREFKASQSAGIFNYDISKVLKKNKIKDKALQLSVQKVITNYNNKINEIALLNKKNFDTLNVYVNALMKFRANNRGQGREGNNRSGNNTRELIRTKIQPARTEVRKAEQILNNELELLLNEKQYSKWLKYQKQVKNDLNPRPNENQNNNARSGGGRQGGGFSGAGGGRR